MRKFHRSVRRTGALLLAALLIGLTGCAPREPAAPTYTFHEYLTEAPVCWDPATRTSPSDCYFAEYTEMGLVSAVYDPTTGGAKWVNEMALSVSDVTADRPDLASRFGLTGDTGLVWEIALNSGACWADGEAITADDYVSSMQRLLDGDYANAARFRTGAAALAGADDYCRNRDAGEALYRPVVPEVTDGVPQVDPDYDGGALYWNPELPCARLGGETMQAEIERYRSEYDCFAQLSRAYQPGEYVPVTDTLRAALTAAAQLYGWTDDDAWQSFCVYQNGVRTRTEWDGVGLFAGKNGEVLYYVCAAETTQADLYAQLAQNWLVDGRLTDAGDYGTSIETYRCYGPYRIASISADRLTLTRNEHWYGYTDGRHNNLYQTTDIECRIESNQSTLMKLMNQGKLDIVALPAENDALLAQYSASRNLLRTPTTYTDRLIFVTDRAALSAISAADPAGGSRMILSDRDFRRAISFAIDRAQLAYGGAVKDRPALGIFSDAYEAGDELTLYRATEPAQDALRGVYGADEDGSVTGYNPMRAAALFTAAYERAVAAGDLGPDESITLRIAIDDDPLGAVRLRQRTLLQAMLDEALAGSPLENRLTVTMVQSDDRYADVAAGRIELAIGAWGGAADRPDSLIRCYTDPAYTEIHEQCGFDPLTESCTLTVGGEAVTHTYYEWGASLNAGGLYAESDADTRLEVRAGLEAALLERCAFIPLMTECRATLVSDRVRVAADDYHPLRIYGGIRSLRYMYSDAEWTAYVRRAGGTLDYTAKN